MDSSVFFFILIMLYLGIIAISIAGQWLLFEKARKPGWACLIPIYNLVVWFQIIGKPMWQLILLIVPFANIYVIITMITGLCKSFGKPGIGNYLLAIFFGMFYIPYLGFSSEVHYIGPAEDKDFQAQPVFQ
jgi:hypothetical protein